MNRMHRIAPVKHAWNAGPIIPARCVPSQPVVSTPDVEPFAEVHPVVTLPCTFLAASRMSSGPRPAALFGAHRTTVAQQRHQRRYVYQRP